MFALRAMPRQLPIALLSLLPMVACAGGSPASSTAGPTAPSALDFTVRDIDGNRVRLSDFRGRQAVLLSFFATWCVPCVAELPHLRSLYQANKARGFIVIAIAVDGPETVANVANFVRRNELPFPTIIDTDSAIADAFDPQKSVPLSVLIDKAGTIVRIRAGYAPGDEELVARDVALVLGAGPTGTDSSR